MYRHVHGDPGHSNRCVGAAAHRASAAHPAGAAQLDSNGVSHYRGHRNRAQRSTDARDVDARSGHTRRARVRRRKYRMCRVDRFCRTRRVACAAGLLRRRHHSDGLLGGLQNVRSRSAVARAAACRRGCHAGACARTAARRHDRADALLALALSHKCAGRRHRRRVHVVPDSHRCSGHRGVAHLRSRRPRDARRRLDAAAGRPQTCACGSLAASARRAARSGHRRGRRGVRRALQSTSGSADRRLAAARSCVRRGVFVPILPRSRTIRLRLRAAALSRLRARSFAARDRHHHDGHRRSAARSGTICNLRRTPLAADRGYRHRLRALRGGAHC